MLVVTRKKDNNLAMRRLFFVKPLPLWLVRLSLQRMGLVHHPSAAILHSAAEETARQIRGLSYKVFIVTW